MLYIDPRGVREGTALSFFEKVFLRNTLVLINSRTCCNISHYSEPEDLTQLPQKFNFILFLMLNLIFEQDVQTRSAPFCEGKIDIPTYFFLNRVGLDPFC